MAAASPKGPDHTLNGAKLRARGEEPKVFSVVDLRAYVKPPLDEELSDSAASPAAPGTETVCQCVPVEECACYTVSHYVGADPCPSHPTCSCHGRCSCNPVYTYYYPWG